MYNRCFLFTLLFCRLLWPCEAIRQQRLTDRQIHGSLPRDGAFGRWEDRCVGQNLRMLLSRQIPLKYVSRSVPCSSHPAVFCVVPCGWWESRKDFTPPFLCPLWPWSLMNCVTTLFVLSPPPIHILLQKRRPTSLIKRRSSGIRITLNWLPFSTTTYDIGGGDKGHRDDDVFCC